MLLIDCYTVALTKFVPQILKYKKKHGLYVGKKQNNFSNEREWKNCPKEEVFTKSGLNVNLYCRVKVQ